MDIVIMLSTDCEGRERQRLTSAVSKQEANTKAAYYRVCVKPLVRTFFIFHRRCGMDADVKELLGKTLVLVTGNKDDDEMIFTTSEGERFKLYHSQQCCENVYIEDIIGNLNNLIGSPLLMAEEVSSMDGPTKPIECGKDDYAEENSTWTFYKFATVKGYVTIRWYGETNGNYSDGVDFAKLS